MVDSAITAERVPHAELMGSSDVPPADDHGGGLMPAHFPGTFKREVAPRNEPRRRGAPSPCWCLLRPHRVALIVSILSVLWSRLPRRFAVVDCPRAGQRHRAPSRGFRAADGSRGALRGDRLRWVLSAAGLTWPAVRVSLGVVVCLRKRVFVPRQSLSVFFLRNTPRVGYFAPDQRYRYVPSWTAASAS